MDVEPTTVFSVDSAPCAVQHDAPARWRHRRGSMEDVLVDAQLVKMLVCREHELMYVY